ncbi:hypothetical protein PGT21_010378 [Puccinia graminis f. sp. tritici]|uniref:Uncharacterized protein n=1 Tax=Puccinia graminis f. sp. tritici TaxID=56615 RepID=A0A5B0R1Z3_PUCGR|nr:hypothetical protein PGT21_010378 [Puccinia graminis f. sp. tritici]
MTNSGKGPAQQILNQRPLLDPTLWKGATLKIAKSCNKMLQTNEPAAQLPSACAAALAELKADNEAREAREPSQRSGDPDGDNEARAHITQ